MKGTKNQLLITSHKEQVEIDLHLYLFESEKIFDEVLDQNNSLWEFLANILLNQANISESALIENCWKTAH